jgi:RNA polymerase sigma-70 factor (ECF subfamily)
MNSNNTLDASVQTHEASQITSVQPSDEELMAAIQMRDSSALETLLDRHRAILKMVILRIVHDHSSADDVMQECLVEIWTRADRYCAEKGKPLGWMVTLAKRRAIDYIRRSIAYHSARDRLEAAVKTQSHTVGITSGCEDADLGRMLQEHLNQLPPLQRQVLSLAFLNGMSQREVARLTHTPLGTVKTRMGLGLSKMRAALRTQRIHSFDNA